MQSDSITKLPINMQIYHMIRMVPSRMDTFSRIMDYLMIHKPKIIVETGTARGNFIDNLPSISGDGGSTLLFGLYAKMNNAIVYSVDISPSSIESSRRNVEFYGLKDYVRFVQDDSVNFLKNNAPFGIDVLYLDSYDYDVNNVDIQKASQEHHLKEIMAVYNKLSQKCAILIDDCMLPGGGKGKLVNEYLSTNNWTLVSKSYQTLWIRTSNSVINKKIIICGVCKNVEKGLNLRMEKIIETGKLFDDYRVVIYENNSSDNTCKIINSFVEIEPRIKFISEILEDEFIKETSIGKEWNGNGSRMERISLARNKVLKEINKDEYTNFDYVFWVDMDITSWSPERLIELSKKDSIWDGVFGNGCDSHGVYYDIYALRDSVMPFGPELLKDWWISPNRTRRFLGNDIIEVYSGFGGCALYKKSAIVGCVYTGNITEDLALFVKEKLSQLKGTSIEAEYRSSIEDKNIAYEKYGVTWLINSGIYNIPAVCEHVTFNASLLRKGKKLFIDPNLRVYY